MKDYKLLELQDVIATGLLDVFEPAGAVSSGYYKEDGCYKLCYHSQEMTVEEVKHLYDYARYVEKCIGIDIRLVDYDED